MTENIGYVIEYRNPKMSPEYFWVKFGTDSNKKIAIRNARKLKRESNYNHCDFRVVKTKIIKDTVFSID